MAAGTLNLLAQGENVATDTVNTTQEALRDTLHEAFTPIIALAPKAIAAVVIVVVGLLVAIFIRGIVATSADRVGITYGEQLAAGCYYVLALMTFVAAFNQLNITFPMLEDVVKITFAGLALGFGLAFGLGGRDVMSGILSGYYIRQRFQSGDKVTLGPMSGTVREVGPVATIIESYEEGLLHRHNIPNNVMLKEAVR